MRKMPAMNKIDAYLAAHKLSQKAFAAKCGVSEANISRLRRGHITPTLAVALRIQAATSGFVSVHDWSKQETAA